MHLATQATAGQPAAGRIKGYPVRTGIMHPLKLNTWRLDFMHRARNLRKNQQQP